METIMAHRIFLSYRRDGGDITAKLISEALKNRGYSTFYDYDALKGGVFDDQIREEIISCTDMVLVLPKDALVRCESPEDWVRQEIALALKHGKNIIPVMLKGFEFPETLPDDINEVRYYNGVRFYMEFFDAVIDSIEKKLRSKPDDPNFNRYAPNTEGAKASRRGAVRDKTRPSHKPMGKSRRRVITVATAAVLLAVLLFAVIYPLFTINKKPYDSDAAFSVLTNGVTAYQKAGMQYESLRELLNALNGSYLIGSSHFQTYHSRLNSIDNITVNDKSSFIDPLLESGEVMEWTGKPLLRDEYLSLAAAYGSRKELYADIVEQLNTEMDDSFVSINSGVSANATSLLDRTSRLIELDADITAYLYAISCREHVMAMRAALYQSADSKDRSTAELIDVMLSEVETQNGHLPSEETDVETLREELAAKLEERENVASGIRSLLFTMIIPPDGGVDNFGPPDGGDADITPPDDDEDTEPPKVDVDDSLIPPPLEEGDVTTDDGTTRLAFINDWATYLSHSEAVYKDVYWVIEYVKAFYDAPSYETLVKARAALSAAKAMLPERTSPLELTLGNAEHMELYAGGYDVYEFVDEMNGFSGIADTVLGFYTELEEHLYRDVFFAPLLEVTLLYPGYVKTELDTDIELLANLTDKLLFILEDKEIESGLPERLETEGFLVREHLAVLSDNIDTVEANESAVLAKKETNAKLLASIKEKETAARAPLNTYLPAGDFIALKGQELTLSGYDRAFALPDTSSLYGCTFVYESDADVPPITVGQTVANIPHTVRVSYTGKAFSDLELYVELLERLGYEPKKNYSELFSEAYYQLGEAYVSVTFNAVSSTLAIEAKGSMSALDAPGVNILLAPEWYVSVITAPDAA